jgi:small-conductance mechanosensitive channel
MATDIALTSRPPVEEHAMEHEEKVVQWFTRMDWIQVGGRIAAILVITIILVYIARRLIVGLEKFTALHAHDVEAKKRAATVSNILRKLATTLIAALATLAIFNTLGISILPFLATAGVAGIAIAFGAQSLVKDFFRGFFLLAGNQIRQGDVVEVAGKSGLVEDLTLRYVQLRDYEPHLRLCRGRRGHRARPAHRTRHHGDARHRRADARARGVRSEDPG